MKPWIRSSLVAALACVPCLAQDSALEPPPLERYLRWGPLRVRPGLELRNVGYDDNVFAANDNEIGDYTATLAPKLDGLVLFGDLAFVTFAQKLGYTAYADNSDQNFTDYLGQARATYPLQRMGFFVEGLYNRTKQRPVDQQDIRADRDEDGLGYGVILQPGWRTELELGRSYKNWRYSDPDADPAATLTIGDRLDRSEVRHRLEIRYRILGRTRLTLEAHTNTIDFASAAASGRDSREWGLLPGVTFGEGGSLTGSVRFGWTRVDADDPAATDFDDLVGRAQLALRPNSRWNLRLNGIREPGFTVSGPGIFFLNTEARVTGVYYFNRIVGVETGGSLGTLEFPDSPSAIERKDHVSSYQGGLRFRLAENSMGRRIEYSLTLRRWRRDSNDDTQDRSRTTLGLGAVVGF